MLFAARAPPRPGGQGRPSGPLRARRRVSSTPRARCPQAPRTRRRGGRRRLKNPSRIPRGLAGVGGGGLAGRLPRARRRRRRGTGWIYDPTAHASYRGGLAGPRRRGGLAGSRATAGRRRGCVAINPTHPERSLPHWLQLCREHHQVVQDPYSALAAAVGAVGVVSGLQGAPRHEHVVSN